MVRVACGQPPQAQGISKGVSPLLVYHIFFPAMLSLCQLMGRRAGRQAARRWVATSRTTPKPPPLTPFMKKMLATMKDPDRDSMAREGATRPRHCPRNPDLFWAEGHPEDEGFPCPFATLRRLCVSVSPREAAQIHPSWGWGPPRHPFYEKPRDKCRICWNSEHDCRNWADLPLRIDSPSVQNAWAISFLDVNHPVASCWRCAGLLFWGNARFDCLCICV